MKKDKNSSNGIGYVLNAQTGNAAGDKVSSVKQKKLVFDFNPSISVGYLQTKCGKSR